MHLHLYVLLASLYGVNCFHVPTVLINTVYGPVKGNIIRNGGSAYYSFTNIRYAKPPIGDLRFAAPQAIDAEWGVHDGTKGIISCYCYDMLSRKGSGIEDCLILNIFSPKRKDDTVLLPVMVFIHGGAFYFGSSATYFPSLLLEENIVLVTINYRLGSLGFLSLGTKEFPGNNGLKDQIMALRMVQTIIADFGGNPDSVTIFGESAGASSVHHLMLSPLSEGLFHKAIVMSGTANAEWGTTQNPVEAAVALAEKLSCSTESPQVIIDCLRTKSYQQISLNQMSANSKRKEDATFPLTFIPCVEPENDFRVITDNPSISLKNGKFMDIPMMIGNDGNELMYLKALIIFDPSHFSPHLSIKSINEDFQITFPSNWNLSYDHPKRIELANKMRDYYLNGEDVNMANAQKLINYINDKMFNFPSHQAILQQHKHQKSPIYHYIYTYSLKFAIPARVTLGLVNEKSAAHAEELITLFNLNKALFFGTDEVVSRNMVKLWTNFAKYGEPTKLMDVEWLPFTEEDRNYLNIDKNLEPSKDYLKERMDFWTDLSKDYL